MTQESNKPEVQQEENKIATPSEQTPTEDATQDQIATLKDQLLRALAEVENTRKRSQREVEEAKKYAVTAFARDVLSVADNLNRGLASVSEEQVQNCTDEVKTMLQGIQLTEKELLAMLEKHGIKKITPLGEPFDHNYHQAMFEIETNEHPAGIVLEVMQPGYVLDSRLLRPAMVGISKTPKS